MLSDDAPSATCGHAGAFTAKNRALTQRASAPPTACATAGSGAPARSFFAPDGELPALHALRLFAVAHIVAMQHAKTTRLTLWGVSCIPFLFLLSGFGAADARLQRGVWSPGLLPRARTVIRRWASVYPLYAVGLLWDVSLQVAAAPPATWAQVTWCAKQLAVNLFMLQAYFPEEEFSATYNPPGWFCSALLLLWLLEEAFCALAAACWRRGTRGRLLALLGVAVWAVAWPYARFPLTGGRLTASREAIRGLQYIHCYFCGCLLSFPLRERLDGVLASLARKPIFSSVPAAHAALLLFTVFVLVHSYSFIQEWGALLVLPLQCLLVYGTAVGYDPVVVVLSVWPLPLAHKVAFGAYILQAPVARTLEHLLAWPEPLNGNQLFVLLSVLICVAAVAQEVVQRALGPALCRLAA